MTEDVEAAFIAKRISIDASLAEIAEHSANPFNIHPGHITWEQLGILTDIKRTLIDLADRLARRAEYVTRPAQMARRSSACQVRGRHYRPLAALLPGQFGGISIRVVFEFTLEPILLTVLVTGTARLRTIYRFGASGSSESSRKPSSSFVYACPLNTVPLGAANRNSRSSSSVMCR